MFVQSAERYYVVLAGAIMVECALFALKGIVKKNVKIVRLESKNEWINSGKCNEKVGKEIVIIIIYKGSDWCDKREWNLT